ncbi:MAG: NHL repeat-containing protein [Bacteroidetes bacterium]|nr:NHL repeat-containing protein [Bacteroidota bacterium]
MSIFICVFLWFQSDSLSDIVVESWCQLFKMASSIAASVDGTLYVADVSDNSVHVVNNKNTIVRTIGGKGWSSEAFDFPSDVATSFLLDIFVSDNNNRRIQRFDKQLQFIQQYNEETIEGVGRCQPIASAVSSTGELYILDADGKRVLQLNSRSFLDKEFGNYTSSNIRIRKPKDIAVTSDNEVVVLDDHQILLYDMFGNYLKSIPLASTIEWNAVSTFERTLIVVSPRLITMIQLETLKEQTIVSKMIIGATSIEPFVDATIVNDRLIVLTNTSLYRCSYRIH